MAEQAAQARLLLPRACCGAPAPAQQRQATTTAAAAAGLAAMLLHKHAGLGGSGAAAAATAVGGDLLAAGSRSSSPYLAPRDANNATGALEAAGTMQLPAPARPLQAGAGAAFAAAAAAAAAAAMKQRLQQQQLLLPRAACCPLDGCCAPCADSQCNSHSSAHTDEPAAGGTPPRAPQAVAPTGAAGAPAPAAQHSHAAAPSDAAPPAAAAAAAPSAPPLAPPPSGARASGKLWLYQLVTCPYLFKPCPSCSGCHSGREVLITYFDPDDPARGYCTYCPQRSGRPRLLQIRRSTYHEVVKAADVSRITDVSGIQHYVINGAKVLFLRPRPQPRPPKGVVAPARCAVDGRQLMDAHSSYCSLRCKLEVEDKVFAAHYPSALQEMEAAAAAAAAGEGDAAATTAGGLAGTFHRQGGHEGRRVVVPGGKRSAAAAGLPAAAAAPACVGASAHDDGSSEDGDVGDRRHSGSGGGSRAKRQRHLPSKFANAVLGDGAPHQDAGASPHHCGGHHHQHRQQQQQRGARVAGRDDTVSDQAAGSLGLAGAGAHPAERARPAASPCASEDSARSSTCNQRWHHKRKVLAPCRAPLQ